LSSTAKNPLLSEDTSLSTETKNSSDTSFFPVAITLSTCTDRLSRNEELDIRHTDAKYVVYDRINLP